MFQKPCTRPGCPEIIRERIKSRFRLRRYCSHRCANKASAEATKQGQHDKALMQACRAILQAVQIEAVPNLPLVRIVRRVRRKAYRAGYAVVQRKVQRAVKRGLLIRNRVIGVDGRRAD